MAFRPMEQQGLLPPPLPLRPPTGGLPPGMPPVPSIPGLPPPPVPPGYPGFPPPPLPPSGSVIRPPGLPPGQPLIPGIPPVMLPVSIPQVTSAASTNSPSSSQPPNDPSKGRQNERSRADNSTGNMSPTTTVFVGNITERASDTLIRQILMKCGIVVSWKRVQGAHGKLQAFGFCEFADPEASLRAIRILHELRVGDKALVVKVDAKTKGLLDDYKKQKRERRMLMGGSDSRKKEDGEADDDDDDELDEETLELDEMARKAVESHLMECGATLQSARFQKNPDYVKPSHSGKEENLEGLDMDDNKKSLVSREIRSFRDTYRKEDKEKEREKREKDKTDKERERGRERERDRDRERERERERRQERSRSPRERKDKDSDRDRDRDREKARERDSERDTDREKSRDRGRDREKEREKERDRGRERDRDEDLDEDELYERRRQERKQRDRDLAYGERLKAWEARERKKRREYDREIEKESEKKDEHARERKHLLEFLEDYEDERDDPKYYKGSGLARRRRDRETEIEADERDRQHELEEIEEIRKRLVDQHTEEEDEEMESDKEDAKPLLQPTFKPALPQVEPAPVVRSPSPEAIESYPAPTVSMKRPRPIAENGQDSEPEPAPKKSFGFEMKLSTNLPAPTSQGRKKLESVFSSQEDEGQEVNEKRRKLVPLDYNEDDSEESLAAQAAEDKKKSIKSLIERIPTAKDELFSYNVDWAHVDQSLVDRRIRPWINKKIVEYIGEEEPTLVEFICTKVLARSMPKNILEDVSMVLDEEAEVFVVKMWRLLIYETEAKKIGLVK